MRARMPLLGACAAVLLGAAWDPAVVELVREGRDLYEAEQFAQAQAKFEEALQQRPELRILHFDLGTVLYKMGDFEGALGQFQGALGDTDQSFASKVYYNIGNCHYRLQRLRLAMDAYRKAIRLSPEDHDARVNLELVAAMLARTELSQRARDAYAKALRLAEKRLYHQALQALTPVLEEEPAAAKRYASFVRRLQQVVGLVPAVEGTKI
jgi:tetratricopeptide (TPR) repeat protein